MKQCKVDGCSYKPKKHLITHARKSGYKCRVHYCEEHYDSFAKEHFKISQYPWRQWRNHCTKEEIIKRIEKIGVKLER